MGENRLAKAKAVNQMARIVDQFPVVIENIDEFAYATKRKFMKAATQMSLAYSEMAIQSRHIDVEKEADE